MHPDTRKEMNNITFEMYWENSKREHNTDQTNFELMQECLKD